MRKFTFRVITACVLLSLLSTSGCNNKRPETTDSVCADTTIRDSIEQDTLSTIIAETPLSKAADELFDDFFFNFAANKKLQLKRIHFPLPVYRNGEKESEIAKNEWRMENFFMRQGYFTLIFDSRKQMDVVKDTAVKRVVVEKILFKIKTIKQYVFNRIRGEWIMTSIGYTPLYESVNGSFLKFYERFAGDSAFQVESMNDVVEFTAPDPDDDFGTITGSIVPEQWPGFKPEIIPQGSIYNILYGQKYTAGTQKILIVRGIANDLETEMIFRRRQGHWKLMKFNS